MDFDGDGKTQPLTDGILLIRYLAGFRGQAMIEDVVDSNAIRSDAESITAWLSQFIVTETSLPTVESTAVVTESPTSEPLTSNGDESAGTNSQSKSLTFHPEEEDEISVPVAPRPIETAAIDDGPTPIISVTENDSDFDRVFTDRSGENRNLSFRATAGAVPEVSISKKPRSGI